MELKRKISLGLAAVFTLGMGALAEPADLQAQLDAANARIEELEAEVEKYRPFYEDQIVAEYGEDGIVWLKDAQAGYQEAAQMFAQYGIPVDSYADQIKQSVVESMVREYVIDAKAAELGVDQIDDAVREDLAAKAAEDLEGYVSAYGSYFASEDATEEENRQATLEGLKTHLDITEESLLDTRIQNYVDEQMHDYVTKDVAVTDEEVQEKYQALLEEQKEDFADDYTYNSTRMAGDVVTWNPEGYRAVKHVLIKFTDDQAKQYSELESTRSSLEDELAALDEAEKAAEAGEATEETEAADTEEAPRSREEIETDLGAVGASLEALYSELAPKAQEVVDAFNAGTDFDALIEQYGEDPGMTREPAASKGYAVRTGSEFWDSAFTEGAMSIAEVGGISEPVHGMNGIHIIYYMADITPGEVPFEEVREGVEAAALSDKIETTYDAQVEAWVEEAHPVYHMDRFI